MTISIDLIDRLRYEGEGESLDFKSAQYAFTGATEDQKGELLKDVLAFANSWRRSDAYILIGFKEVIGGKAEVVGVGGHFDDADLQQFVNSKTNRPIRFSYHAMVVENAPVAIVHIPLQERPFFLLKKYGRLEGDIVYVRRGSSTAVARPDEIARMGQVAGPAAHDIALDVFFGDPHTGERIEGLVDSLVLGMPPSREIPDYHTRAAFPMIGLPVNPARPEYYRELARFTRIDRLVSPLWFAIRNDGTTTAHDVRLEVTVPSSLDGMRVIDDDDFPSVPEKEFDLRPFVRPPIARLPADIAVSRVGDSWRIRGRVDKVQPKSTVWFHDPIYLGAESSGDIPCSVRISADNLSVPHEQTIQVSVKARSEQVNLTRILELESERLANSPAHREFLRRLNEGDE